MPILIEEDGQVMTLREHVLREFAKMVEASGRREGKQTRVIFAPDHPQLVVDNEVPQVRDEPLEKVTFDASQSDMAWLRSHVGGGRVAWTLRQLVKQYRRRCEAELEETPDE